MKLKCISKNVINAFSFFSFLDISFPIMGAWTPEWEIPLMLLSEGACLYVRCRSDELPGTGKSVFYYCGRLQSSASFDHILFSFFNLWEWEPPRGFLCSFFSCGRKTRQGSGSQEHNAPLGPHAGAARTVIWGIV